MKRREFLIASAGVAGTLPLVGFGRPCPPSQVNVQNGQSATGTCSNVTAEQDWISRSTGSGVVWAHNFASASEVNQFRYANGKGNDPTQSLGGTNVVWNSSDGFAGGGCLEVDIPTGSTGANASWQRPMSALHAGQPSGGGAGNGLSTDDPAAGGTVALRTWNSATTSAIFNWRTGYYANPAVQTKYPYWPLPGDTGIYDGNSFYLQFRVKISGSRWTTGNPDGKLLLIEPAAQLSDLQEIVVRSVNKHDAETGFNYVNTNPFLVYTSRGGYANSVLQNPQGSSSGSIETAGPYASSCTGGHTSVVGACWEFPADQWVTVLLQLVPGQDNSNYTGNAPSGSVSTWPYHDTVLNAWVCPINAANYTQVFGMNNIALFYYTSGDPGAGSDGPNGMWHPPAFNALEFSGYMNNQPIVSGWSQKFTQIIFSKQFIPCPVA